MRNFVILLFMSVLAFDSVAATYHIDRARDGKIIYDHSNPNTIGSIAWYFKNKGANHRFVLSTPTSGGSYAIEAPLELPKGSTLESTSQMSWIKAVKRFDPKGNTKRPSFMLGASSGSAVSNIIFDGNYVANNIIHGRNVFGFRLTNSIIRRTINIYDEDIARGGKISAHGVLLRYSRNITIMFNTIENIGDSGVNVPNNSGQDKHEGIIAGGISLRDSDDLLITGNLIRYTLSAGVDTTNSKNVTITYNTIDNVGRSNLYKLPFSADGITAYHNTRFEEWEDMYYEVSDNKITNWYNHGIHLSGRRLSIAHNHVALPGGNTPGSAIFIGDWRTRVRCSSIIWMNNNYVERSSNSQSKGIRARHYKHSAYWPSGNTGDTGNGLNVIDHRYGNLPTVKFAIYPGERFKQISCPVGYADTHYDNENPI